MIKLLTVIVFLTNVLNAEIVKKYYKTGELSATAQSKNGMINGKVKRFYKNGKLRDVLYFKNDKKTNINTTQYAYQGNITYSLYIKNKETPPTLKKNKKIFTGKLILFYKGKEGSDLIFGRSLFIASSAGNDDGEIKLTGNKRLVSYWQNGKISGLMTRYYRNGKLKSKTYFKNGYPTGIWTSYTDKGIKYSLTSYKNGKKDGLDILYVWKSYRRSRNTNYKNGKKHGKEETYFENGNLSSEAKFIKGKEEGTHLEYWENGLISNKITMKNGKAISGTWWDDKGNIGGSMTNAQFKEFSLEY